MELCLAVGLRKSLNGEVGPIQNLPEEPASLKFLSLVLLLALGELAATFVLKSPMLLAKAPNTC